SNEAIAHFVPLSPNAVGPEYLYCYLSGFDSAKLGSTSSIATATNSKAVKAMPILIPAATASEGFTALVRALFDAIRRLERESDKLGEIRNLLLPQLLSGKVRALLAQNELEMEVG